MCAHPKVGTKSAAILVKRGRSRTESANPRNPGRDSKDNNAGIQMEGEEVDIGHRHLLVAEDKKCIISNQNPIMIKCLYGGGEVTIQFKGIFI